MFHNLDLKSWFAYLFTHEKTHKTTFLVKKFCIENKSFRFVFYMKVSILNSWRECWIAYVEIQAIWSQQLPSKVHKFRTKVFSTVSLREGYYEKKIQFKTELQFHSFFSVTYFWLTLFSPKEKLYEGIFNTYFCLDKDSFVRNKAGHYLELLFAKVICY